MDFNSIVLFNKKTFADLLKEIYDNSKNKSKSIKLLLESLPVIVDIGTANTVGPLVVGLIKEDVKNDENLIKLAGLIQRIVSTSNPESDEILTDEEKQQLMGEANSLVKKISNSNE